MKAKPHTHCLWVDWDTGMVYMDVIDKIAEPVPYGGHVPAKTGTEAEIKRLLTRITKRPCLIEKLLKW